MFKNKPAVRFQAVPFTALGTPGWHAHRIGKDTGRVIAKRSLFGVLRVR